MAAVASVFAFIDEVNESMNKARAASSRFSGSQCPARCRCNGLLGRSKHPVRRTPAPAPHRRHRAAPAPIHAVGSPRDALPALLPHPSSRRFP
ncbi:hypothetical protein G6F46_015439 [Rhizopus delemar]|nr:hypothetical protein G6F24_016629 [Rhizopus arrhizus]KAG0774334.1 hypothetical protein G6F22_014145 [Rhizopus arrhizus]KAG1384151.1 hypothetical protein G6F59_017753 [Rhizopus arrhizus]KAG1580957.1 hypothetical protein G6F46_015439 [Rhizopus delemar]